jgi:hypothetical protein
MTKFILLGTLSFMMSAVYAAPPTTKVTAKAADCPEPATGLEKDMRGIASKVSNCPNANKLTGICLMVSSKQKDKTPGSTFEFLYERAIYEASCADYDNDSEAVIAQKVSNMFAKFQDRLVCQGADFDVAKGNILKYAVNARAYGFINQAIDEWKVNLNVVDKNDNTTVLDYVEKQVQRAKGTSFEEELKIYYTRLKKAGAKHSRELKA